MSYLRYLWCSEWTNDTVCVALVDNSITVFAQVVRCLIRRGYLHILVNPQLFRFLVILVCVAVMYMCVTGIDFSSFSTIFDVILEIFWCDICFLMFIHCMLLSTRELQKMADCLFTRIMYFVLYFTMFSLIVVTIMLNFE
jgi:hypothetical protein